LTLFLLRPQRYFSHWQFFTSGDASCSEKDELMNVANAILLVICALLCGYLLYALLKAEEF
jgi:K+-transporting ATPase KdpF subunit